MLYSFGKIKMWHMCPSAALCATPPSHRIRAAVLMNMKNWRCVFGPPFTLRPCGKRKFTGCDQGGTMKVYFRAEHCRAEHCRVDGKEAGGRSLPRDKSAKPTRNTKTQQDQEDRNCPCGRLRSFSVRKTERSQEL